MMNKLTIAFLLLSAPMTAQNQPGEGRYRYDDATQLWRNTGNAAGLTIDSTRNRGVTFMGLEHGSGNYHRVQEGGMYNRLRFFTERYQHLGRYLYGYGQFEFGLGRTKDRAWADVMRPYNADPYFSGSSIPAKYDHQNIGLKAAVGTVSFNGWRFGLAIDYKVGDLSRLRDPRSRSQLLDYKLAPAVTYTAGRHTLGVAAHYNRRKEKIPNLTTVQSDATLKYYQMTGLENATGTTGGYGGYQREWVNHSFGAALTYGYSSQRVGSVTTIGIERGSEGVMGQYKFEPGHYYNYIYTAATQNRLYTATAVHQLDISARYEQGYADEYRSQLIIERDSARGFNSYRYDRQLTFRKRYQVRLADVSLHYRASFTQGERQTDSYVGLTAALQRAANRYLLDASELSYGRMNIGIEGGHGFLGHRLLVDAAAGYAFATKTDMHLADETTDYARSVLLPDLLFYNANYWRGRLQATWQFPLTIKKVRSTWYVRAYAATVRAQQSRHFSTFGFAVGIFN